MKYILLFIPFALFSCAAHYYKYDVSMTHPINSKTLNYENDTLSISFNLESKDISVKIYNKLNEGIRINWDEVSFSVNGKTYRAVHGETGLGNITQLQPPTTIPPKSNLNDIIIPSDKVNFIRVGNRTSTSIGDLFPDYDYGKKKQKAFIEHWRGVRVTIYLPMYIHNQFISAYYDLLINDVVEDRTRKHIRR